MHFCFVFWRQTNFTKFTKTNCATASFFIKVAWKRDPNTATFLWILRDFEERYFMEHFQVTTYEVMGEVVRNVLILLLMTNFKKD